VDPVQLATHSRARLLSRLVLAAQLFAVASCVPAFPGAQGFGSDTPGGRGGAVLFVDNLNDSGAGSLRAAVERSGPRIVVFRVGGTITLQSPLVIAEPYLTVAGQTAPGGGIQLRNDPDAPHGHAVDSFSSVEIRTHDVVLRHLRIRPGPLHPNPACTAPNAVASPRGWPTCVDANDIEAIHITSQARAILLDHLSLAWTSDEVIDIEGAAADVTIQWSIISESLDFVLYEGFAAPVHPFHGTGIIAGGAPVSIHHNLWAHLTARAPQLSTRCVNPDPAHCTAEIVNNVVYNWQEFGTHVSNIGGHQFVNLVGNYYRPGPDTMPDAMPQAMGLNDWVANALAMLPNARIGVFASDNRRFATDSQSAALGVLCSRWSPASNRFVACDLLDYANPRFQGPPIATTSADQARTDLLADVGASRRIEGDGSWSTARDATDARVIDDVRRGTGRIIRRQQDFPGWPVLSSGPAAADFDRDGMPDAFEIRHRLSPAHPSDGPADADDDGYTNVEEFLNGTDPWRRG
jgi:hypothetical protein